MSGKIVGEVLENAPANLRIIERWVLLVLAYDAAWRTRTTTSSIRTHTRRARLSPGATRTAVDSLAAQGLITATPHGWRITELRRAQP